MRLRSKLRGCSCALSSFIALHCQVLSVIAQQIMTLQGAVQRGEKRVIFEDVRWLYRSHRVYYFEAKPVH